MTISVTDTATGQELTVREIRAALDDSRLEPSSLIDRWATERWGMSLDSYIADCRAAIAEAQLNLQPLGIRDVEPPSETPPPLEVRNDVPTRVEWADAPPDLIGGGVGPALRGRYGTKGEPSPFDPTPAPDENMPGRVALTPRDGLQEQAERYARQQALRQRVDDDPDFDPPDIPKRRFVPNPANYGPHPALEPSIEGTYTRAGGAVDWRAEWAALKTDLARPLRWWRHKQAQRDERMGVEQ